MNELLTLLAEISAVFAVALLGARLASRRSAAVRHLILASAFGIALILPLATLVSPTITVEIAALPARAADPIAVIASILPEELPAAFPQEPSPGPQGNLVATAAETMPQVAMPQPANLPRPLPATTWLLFVWAIVALIALVPVGRSLWLLRSIGRRSHAWPEGAAQLAQLMPGTAARRPLVMLCEGIAAPIAAGLRCATITLPASASTWSEEHLANALLHELEHVRRHDWTVHLAARVACALYWFHPLAWITWRHLRLEAEQACDDAVMAHADAATYAEQLLDLARHLAGRPALPGLQMAGGGSLTSRIKAILDITRPRGRAGRLQRICTAVIAVAAVLVLAPLRAAGPHPPIKRTQSPPARSQPELPAAHQPPVVDASAGGFTIRRPAEPAPPIAPIDPRREVVASILALVQSALADEATRTLDEIMYPITGLQHVQRFAQAVLDNDRVEPALQAGNYLEIINALNNTADLAESSAARPPAPGISAPRYRQLARQMRARSAELAALVMPVTSLPNPSDATPQLRAAQAVLELTQMTRAESSAPGSPWRAWMLTELDTLDRAAQSIAGDDGRDSAATALTRNMFRLSMHSTARQADRISERADASADARHRTSGLAASLRDIANRLASASITIAPAPEVTSVSRDWLITVRAAGPLAIGMPITEVRRIIGDPSSYLVQALHQDHALPREPDTWACGYLVTHSIPAQLGLMFQYGRLARVDVWQPGIRTSGSAMVGDSETRIRNLYGTQLTITQHHYGPVGAHYMTYTPAVETDRGYLLRFETDGNNVTQFRVGLRAAVEATEGCE